MNKQFSQTWLVAALSLALGFFSVGEQAQKLVGDRAKPDQHSSRVTYNTVYSTLDTSRSKKTET
jgi:hypothetical protein